MRGGFLKKRIEGMRRGVRGKKCQPPSLRQGEPAGFGEYLGKDKIWVSQKTLGKKKERPGKGCTDLESSRTFLLLPRSSAGEKI